MNNIPTRKNSADFFFAGHMNGSIIKVLVVPTFHGKKSNDVKSMFVSGLFSASGLIPEHAQLGGHASDRSYRMFSCHEFLRSPSQHQR